MSDNFTIICYAAQEKQETNVYVRMYVKYDIKKRFIEMFSKMLTNLVKKEQFKMTWINMQKCDVNLDGMSEIMVFLSCVIPCVSVFLLK